MKIRALIVDDERVARARLRRLLGADAEVEIVAECADGASAVAAVREHAPDLLLLDVQMPGLDGFATLEALAAHPEPLVVFVTAFDEHAIRAFEQCALDYLLKPASPARIAKTLERVRHHLALRLAAAPPEPSPSAGTLRFRVRSGQRTYFVALEEIDWISADGNYAVLHTGRQGHLLRETMAKLEALLPPRSFCRISRSAIVQLAKVKELVADAQGRHWTVMQHGERVQISRSIREIEERLAGLA
jgi:two-component system, LytTR family, response regulator